jgi:hypothetical protein
MASHSFLYIVLTVCDPLTAIAGIGLAVGVGSAVMEHNAQNQAAAANEQNALSALRIESHELSLREVEERIAGNQLEEQADAAVLEAVGDVNANAAANGVSGMTVDMLLHDVDRQGASYRDSVEQNTDTVIAQLEREKAAALVGARNRITSVPRANPLATGLKIAGAGLDFASMKIGQKPKGT